MLHFGSYLNSFCAWLASILFPLGKAEGVHTQLLCCSFLGPSLHLCSSKGLNAQPQCQVPPADCCETRWKNAR